MTSNPVGRPADRYLTQNAPGGGVAAAARRVQSYNFRRPSRFSKEQLRTIQAIYEQFGRSLSSSLSSFLRLNVRIQVDTVEPAGFEEFVDRLPNPTTLYVLRLDPLSGPILVEMSLAPARVMLDRLCGGPGLAGNQEQHLTDIERSLLRPLGRHILRASEEAWGVLVTLTAAIEDILVNPRAARAVAPNDVVALVTMEVAIGDVTGQLAVCLPHLALEPIVDRLSSRAWRDEARDAEQEETEEMLRARLQEVPLPLVIRLGEVDVPATLLLSLREGDVLRLGTPIQGDLVGAVDDRPTFRCRPGVSDGRIAVRVEGLRDPSRLLD